MFSYQLSGFFGIVYQKAFRQRERDFWGWDVKLTSRAQPPDAGRERETPQTCRVNIVKVTGE